MVGAAATLAGVDLLAGSDARIWFLRDSIAKGDVSKACEGISEHHDVSEITYCIFEIVECLLVVLPSSSNAYSADKTPFHERSPSFRSSSGIVSKSFHLKRGQSIPRSETRQGTHMPQKPFSQFCAADTAVVTSQYCHPCSTSQSAVARWIRIHYRIPRRTFAFAILARCNLLICILRIRRLWW